MKELIRTNLPLAGKFNRTFRYIDDLLTINNSKFSDYISKIYPSELELKKTTESQGECSYLDLNIKIINSKFTTDLYDKREAFNFNIVNYPHMDSNIPLKPAYGVFISQLIRYLRVCGNYQHFVYRSIQITTRLQRQGFDYVVLCNTFKKFLQRHPIALRKYRRSHRQMIVDCVCLPLCVFSTKNKHITVR